MKRGASILSFTFALFFAWSSYADNFAAIRKVEDFVPFSQVADEFRSDKFACLNFDTQNMTCTEISKATTWWLQDAREFSVLIKKEPRFFAKMTIVFQEIAHADGLYCSRVKSVSVHIDIPPHLLRSEKAVFAAKEAENNIENTTLNRSLVCDAYFKSERGYTIKSYDKNGNIHPDLEQSNIEFFQKKPGLREFLWPSE